MLEEFHQNTRNKHICKFHYILSKEHYIHKALCRPLSELLLQFGCNPERMIPHGCVYLLLGLNVLALLLKEISDRDHCCYFWVLVFCTGD